MTRCDYPVTSTPVLAKTPENDFPTEMGHTHRQPHQNPLRTRSRPRCRRGDARAEIFLPLRPAVKRSRGNFRAAFVQIVRAACANSSGTFIVCSASIPSKVCARESKRFPCSHPHCLQSVVPVRPIPRLRNDEGYCQDGYTMAQTRTIISLAHFQEASLSRSFRSRLTTTQAAIVQERRRFRARLLCTSELPTPTGHTQLPLPVSACRVRAMRERRRCAKMLGHVRCGRCGLFVHFAAERDCHQPTRKQ